MPINVIIFLTAATVIRVALASLFPLTADESYYWLWSKHLSLSYVDHPPLVAIVNYLMTLGTENLLMIRFGAVLITLLVSLMIYFLARNAFNEKVAFWSVVIFQLIPHFVIIWLTQFVELPLVLFWTASLLILSQLIRTRDAKLWYLLALILGLGYLSKYTMFQFWPCLAVFFFLSPDDRYWLKRKEPYLCFILGLILFLPVIIWNVQHDWVSFAFHSAKATSDAWFAHFLPFIGDQLVHFTPFLIFSFINIFQYARSHDRETKLLFSFSAPLLLLFFIVSFKIKIWAHWPASAYIAAIPLAAAYLIQTGRSYKKFVAWISLFTALILAILLFLSPAVLLHQQDYAKNFDLPKMLPAGIKVFAKTNVTASLLEFYAKRQTYLATGFLKPHPIWGEQQYEIWGIPNLKPGETVLYYGEDSPLFREKASVNFEKISELPSVRLYLIEDYISNNYRMFKLEGFKGTGLHP